MRKLVNAGLESGEEFAARIMRWEVFYSPAIDGVTRSYRFSKDYQFVTTTSNCIYFEEFYPLGLTEDALANMMIEQELTLAELIKIKPRLCRVFDGETAIVKHIRVIESVDENGRYVDKYTIYPWNFAEMLTDEEIKQFLSEE